MDKPNEWLDSLNQWSSDNLDMVWDFVNGRDFTYWVTWAGIYYSAIFFVCLAGFMVALKPRASIEKGFTWLMVAMALVLIRVIYNHYFDPGPVFWSTLIWINLAVSITYTSYSVITDKFVRRNAAGIFFRRKET